MGHLFNIMKQTEIVDAFNDFLGGLGWTLPCFPKWLTASAVGGYSREGQTIKSNHAKLSTPAGNQGHVKGRHSKLQATWTGPWAGIGPGTPLWRA